MLEQPNIRYLTDIYFEAGAVKALPLLLEKYAINRPLVVTDKALVQLGMVAGLRLSNAFVFDHVETNPTESMAEEAAKHYSLNHCDGIIAFGGGSPIDLAKCAAILINHPPPLESYAFTSGGSANITNNIPPLIAIPTTAGSGSEVGRAALITLNSGKKIGIISEYLLPRASICDSHFTMSMPAMLTAATGMDAISHCVECFCSPRFNPVADAIALSGLHRGFNNIINATHAGDLESRTEMMMCSLEGGLSFQKGLGAVHSLSHPLGALTSKKLHHGTLNAIFLPHVLRYNAACCFDKFKLIAERLNIENASSLPGVFDQLNNDLGLATRLRDLGVTKSDLEPLAEIAFNDHCTPTNPRVMQVSDFALLYDIAW